MLLVERYSRSPKFIKYSYREDMKSEALLNLCNNALKFNPEKSSNPFAFYTTAIHHSFLQYLNHERKQRTIRDTLLVEHGDTPSYSFQENGQEYLNSVYGTDSDNAEHQFSDMQIINDGNSEVEVNVDNISVHVDYPAESIEEQSFIYEQPEHKFVKQEKIVPDQKLPKKVLRKRHINQFVDFL